MDEVEASGEELYGDGEFEDLDDRSDVETALMADAPEIPMPLGGVEALRGEGVVLVKSALSPKAASELRSAVLMECEKAAEGDFSEILSPFGRGGEQRRYDLQMPLTPHVVSALGVYSPLRLALPRTRNMLTGRTAGEMLCAVTPLGLLLDSVVGPRGELRELAAFVSKPGCRQQVTHSDTTWTDNPALFTTFVALQPITRDMGPTRFIPGWGSALTRATCKVISSVQRCPVCPTLNRRDALTRRDAPIQEPTRRRLIIFSTASRQRTPSSQRHLAHSARRLLGTPPCTTRDYYTAAETTLREGLMHIP